MTKLEDIRRQFGDRPHAEELAPELSSRKGQPLDILSHANIRRFVELVQIGRREIEAGRFNPDFIAPMHCIDLAHHLRVRIATKSDLIV